MMVEDVDEEVDEEVDEDEVVVSAGSSWAAEVEVDVGSTTTGGIVGACSVG